MHPKRCLPNISSKLTLAKYVSQTCTCQKYLQLCICQICIPNGACQIYLQIVHLPKMHPKRALAKYICNYAFAKYASQMMLAKYMIQIVHLANMHPEGTLPNTCAIMHLTNINLKWCLPNFTCSFCAFHILLIEHQQFSKLDRNLTRTWQKLSKTLTPAADRLEPRGATVLPPGGLRLNKPIWSLLNGQRTSQAPC